jgi:hypothetical protein
VLGELLLPVHDREPVGLERRLIGAGMAKCLPLEDKGVEDLANPVNGIRLIGGLRQRHSRPPQQRQRAGRKGRRRTENSRESHTQRHVSFSIRPLVASVTWTEG